jgi:ethanolamine kinase
VVYCHNDLLAPNVLLSTSASAPGELHLIDFEYGCYNYRGFDLGNHFNEWAGFDCEYWRYPADTQQRAFLAAYAGGDVPAAETDSPAVDALVIEANVFSLASHLYWGIWALIQAKCAPPRAGNPHGPRSACFLQRGLGA